MQGLSEQREMSELESICALGIQPCTARTSVETGLMYLPWSRR